jgi:tRNA threonylcarbamoyladenosine biosynthesis protein TsaB
LDAYSQGFEYFDGAILPVIDARKKRVYSSIYYKGIKKSKDMDISPEELLELVKDYNKVLITGPGAKLFSNLPEINNRIYIDHSFKSTSSFDILNLGKKKFLEYGTDANGIGPVYLRKSEAEISLYGE